LSLNDTLLGATLTFPLLGVIVVEVVVGYHFFSQDIIKLLE